MTVELTASWSGAAKWAVRESGDAVLVRAVQADRVLALIVDVQGSGAGAGKTAWSLASLASELATDGADAAAIAGMLNRALWSRRGGRVQAGLGIALWEPETGASTATYGSVLVDCAAQEVAVAASTEPAGLAREAQPAATDHGPRFGTIVMCSDGIASSREDLRVMVGHLPESPPAEAILATAVARDMGRPRNDMSVIVLSTRPVDSSGATTLGEVRFVRRSPVPVREVFDA